MNQRMNATVRLASILIVVIMGASLLATMSRDRDARFEDEEAWSTSFSDVQSLQVIDLDGDGANDLFVQNRDSYTVYDAQGTPLWSERPGAPLSTTMGDVDADGDEDLVIFQSGGTVRATSGGAPLWTTTLDGVSQPARSAVVRFASGTQVVVGDDQGRLVALRGSDGRPLWQAALSGRGETRGLDDALIEGDRLLVAADRSGQVTAFDDSGATAWSASIAGLRRMRTFDLDGDGMSEVYFGGEGGTLHTARHDGQRGWTGQIGQQVVEVRDGELDGNPTSREVVVGGRDGGVVAYDARGGFLWGASVGNRISDIVTVDLDDDGADETVVGDEGGGLTVFSGRDGSRFSVRSMSGGVAALDEGRLTASDQVAVASGTVVAVTSLTRVNAPFFYSPLVAGLVLSLAIAGAALFVGSLPEQATTRVVVTDSSPAGLLARRRMLSENISDVEGLRARGEIEGSAALAKLQELRTQLAETDKALRETGVSAAAETMKCPNCGGRVRLGRDKCDYCGEVVIL